MANNLKLAEIFQDHMMFQADAPIRIFGSCEINTTITVTVFNKTFDFNFDGTTFLIELPAFDFTLESFDITIQSKEDSIVIQDCIFGDLFIASGQSNMQFTMKESLDEPIEDNPLIRFYEVPKLPYVDAHIEFPYFYSSNPHWFSCTKAEVKNFSAIGYFVATSLFEQLKRPIGIISCNMGDTSVFSWIDKASLFDQESLKPYLDFYQTEIDKYRSVEEYNERYHIQLPRLMEFYGQIDKGIKEGLSSDKAHEMAFKYYPDPYIPMGWKHYNRPSGCFDMMVQKVVPLSIKAALYYQGESDHQNKDLYEVAFKTMIQSWRKSFKNPKLPFVYVQVANYLYPGTINHPIAEVRDAQTRCMNPKDLIYMVSAIDLGEANNIHPKDKKVVSKRISNILLEYLYQKGSYSLSPQFDTYFIKNQLIEIHTKNNDLPLISKSQQNHGFYAFTDDSTLIEINDVKIRDKTINIPYLPSYKVISYGFTSNPVIDIYSKNDLPLLPFKINL
jgi:sialate O-acetylesterase